MDEAVVTGRVVSIRALHAEGDRAGGPDGAPVSGFNPRPPRGGRQGGVIMARTVILFQSAPSTRRATKGPKRGRVPVPVSIRALHAEGDREVYPVCLASDAFQSAPSTRRATRRTPHKAASPSGFNPRPPRGGRPDGRPLDPNHHWFQSAPSTRRATCRVVSAIHDDRVSIRALHAEGDTPDLVSHSGGNMFQSAPSTRRATPMWTAACCRRKFQSAPSTRRATRLPGPGAPGLSVSIRALHAEGDQYRRRWAPVGSSFNPRPPRGGRPRICRRPPRRTSCFNPRPPRGGRHEDQAGPERSRHLVSIRALHAEGDRLWTVRRSGTMFQSAPSTRRATAVNATLCQRRC